jgi:hypothetical protein
LNLYAETSEKGLECKRLGAARQQKYPIGTEVTEFDNFKMQNIAGKEIYTTTIVYTAYPIERPDIRPAKTRPIASSTLCSMGARQAQDHQPRAQPACERGDRMAEQTNRGAHLAAAL